jgi:hypothetical protein
MIEGPRFYVSKYRLGLDNSVDWGPLIIRLEGVAGRDSKTGDSPPERPERGTVPVFGYYGEARYALVRWLEPVVAYDGFHHGEGSARTLSAGLNFHPPDVSAFEIQTAYQRNFLNTVNQNMEDWHVIVQLVVRF